MLLQNPHDYYLSLIRFKIPALNFPVLLFENDPTSATENAGDYFVTMFASDDPDVVEQTQLVYTNYNLLRTDQDTTQYYHIFTFSHFIRIINEALANCLANLPTAPPAADPPFFVFDPVTRLIEFHCSDTFLCGENGNGPFEADVNILFSWKLYVLLTGFQYLILDNIPGSNIDVKFLTFKTLEADNNDDTIIVQDFTSIANWNPVKQVVFETRLLPVQAQWTATSNDSFKKVLQDFEPLQNANNDLRSVLQYFPDAQYRLVDVLGTTPIYQIDLSCKWVDIDGVEYFVEIPNNQIFSAKLGFIKRNLYKSNNLIYE